MGFYLGIVAVLLVFAALTYAVARREGGGGSWKRNLTDQQSSGTDSDRANATHLNHARAHQTNHRVRNETTHL